MIKPKEMTMVRIIGPSTNVRKVIETLYEMKILHIIDFKKTDDQFFDIGKPLKEATYYSQQLIDLRSIIAKLNLTGEPKFLRDFDQASRKFPKLNKRFRELVAELEKLKAEEIKLSEDSNNPLTALGILKDEIKDYKSLVSFTGVVKSEIESKISSITSDYILEQVKLGKQTAFALFVKREFEGKIKAILTESGFSEYKPPSLKKSEVEEKLSKVRKEIDTLEKELVDFSKANSKFIIDYEFALTQLNEKAEAPLRFASSKSAFVASGWVPTATAEQLKENLGKITKEKVSIELLHGENPPTALENPKLASPFEFLLDMYSLPRYYEIDPTILMFITFPLFFGFMLGDVGYGLTTLVIAFLLERKLPIGVKPLIRIITIASLAAVAFGFVFGEFFGYEFLHPLLNRSHDVNTMMLVAIAVGVVHLNFGLILGFVNELKHHGFLNAFFRKISWIILQVGVAILAVGSMQSSQSFQIVGGVLAVASVLMIIKGDGFIRIVELPALLSNILSYIRLYAIGLASVSLASVFNKMASGLFVQGGVSIVFGVLVLMMGHFVNLLLGLLGPFLHSLRLHYVEFFQKFYEGGGYRYNPFGIIKMLGGR